MLIVIALTAVLAGVGIMIDAVDDSELDSNQATPQTEQVVPSSPNDTPIGAEGGPYK